MHYISLVEVSETFEDLAGEIADDRLTQGVLELAKQRKDTSSRNVLHENVQHRSLRFTAEVLDDVNVVKLFHHFDLSLKRKDLEPKQACMYVCVSQWDCDIQGLTFSFSHLL